MPAHSSVNICSASGKTVNNFGKERAMKAALVPLTSFPWRKSLFERKCWKGSMVTTEKGVPLEASERYSDMKSLLDAPASIPSSLGTVQCYLSMALAPGEDVPHRQTCMPCFSGPQTSPDTRGSVDNTESVHTCSAFGSPWSLCWDLHVSTTWTAFLTRTDGETRDCAVPSRRNLA